MQLESPTSVECISLEGENPVTYPSYACRFEFPERPCKGGETTCSNFTIAGPYVEWLLLGAISWRFPNQKLLWDGKNLRFTNNNDANAYIKPQFRKGWKLKDIKV